MGAAAAAAACCVCMHATNFPDMRSITKHVLLGPSPVVYASFGSSCAKLFNLGWLLNLLCERESLAGKQQTQLCLMMIFNQLNSC